MSGTGAKKSGMLPAVLAVIVGGGLVMTAASMVVTGVAKRELAPRVSAQLRDWRKKLEPPAEPAAEAEPAVLPVAAAPSGASASDSLFALETQIETQRRFLERERDELAALRMSIDSLLTRYDTERNEEAARQAKLLAAMKPNQAAEILGRMDDASLHAVLAGMNAKAASRIVAVLDPDRMARLAMEDLSASAVDVLPAISSVSLPEPEVESP